MNYSRLFTDWATRDWFWPPGIQPQREISKTGEWRRVKLSLTCVQLFATPWTVARQAPLCMGFSRQEYRSGLPFPSPGHLPHPGIKPRPPALQADSLPSEPQGGSNDRIIHSKSAPTCQRVRNKTFWWWSWSQKKDECLCAYLCHQWNRWVFLVSINQGRESHSREPRLMIMGQNSIGTGNSGLFWRWEGSRLRRI